MRYDEARQRTTRRDKREGDWEEPIIALSCVSTKGLRYRTYGRVVRLGFCRWGLRVEKLEGGQ